MSGLLPKNIDYGEPCASMATLQYGGVILRIGGMTSCICYAYIFWMYFVLKSPLLHRHPLDLAVYQCICQFFICQQYLWFENISNDQLYIDYSDEPPIYCNASKVSAILSFITLFLLVMNQLIFFIISNDLRNSYTNPFFSVKDKFKFMMVIAVIYCFFNSVGLMIAGRAVYGPSNIGRCKIQRNYSTVFFLIDNLSNRYSIYSTNTKW